MFLKHHRNALFFGYQTASEYDAAIEKAVELKKRWLIFIPLDSFTNVNIKETVETLANDMSARSKVYFQFGQAFVVNVKKVCRYGNFRQETFDNLAYWLKAKADSEGHGFIVSQSNHIIALKKSSKANDEQNQATATKSSGKRGRPRKKRP